MNRKVFLALALLAMVSLAAFAHDTWLTPGKFVVQPGAKVSLDLTSGMAFPHSGVFNETDQHAPSFKSA